MNGLSRYTPNCPISPFFLTTGLNSGESELLLHHGKVRLLCSPWFGWAIVVTWYAALEPLDGLRRVTGELAGSGFHVVVITVPWTVSPV